MAPLITYTDGAGAPIDPEFDFLAVPPGSTSATQVLQIHNAAGADVAPSPHLRIEAKPDGDDEWVGSGLSVLDSRAFQAQVTVESGVAVSRGITRLGTGMALFLPDLEPDTFHEIDFSIMPSSGGNQITTQHRLQVVIREVVPVGDPFAVRGPGIFRGPGRGGQGGGVLARSGAFGVTGNDQLDQPDYSYYVGGFPHSELLQAVTIDDVDGDTAALVATESYLFYRVYTAAGTLTVKGSKGVGRVFPDDAPVLTDGQVALGWGERDFAADLTFTELPGANEDYLACRVESGLTVIIGNTGAGVPALVEFARIDTTTETAFDLTDDATNTIFQNPDGTFSVSLDGSSPQVGAMSIWRFTFVAGVVTEDQDLRKWADDGGVLTFVHTAPSGTEDVPLLNNTTRSWFIRPDMVSAYLKVDPQSLVPPPTGGSIIFDLFVQLPGQLEVPSYPSSGTDDRRPTFPFGGTSQAAKGLPETGGLEIPPGAVLISRSIESFTGPNPTPEWGTQTVGVNIG